ncbi:MAG: protein translocase subunit SecF [Candidatus Caenarcaniphilales bacterium]|jgi:preprotein translocase subunit SecF|nr:protein translocase subunit SecF [Candidatus Caenarcaniphilales bacterium]
MQVNSVKHGNIWLTVSGALVVISVIIMIFSTIKTSSPFKLGLDFTGGTKLEYRFAADSKLDRDQIQKILVDSKLAGSQITIEKSNEPLLILRTRAISDDTALDTLNTSLTSAYGDFKVEAIDTVSPIIGPELLSSGLIALGCTILGIVLYISFRFKRDYAFCGIAALVHDVIIVMGLFSFLGLYYGIEVDSLFITALLSTFGFSIHDTIVVFDRIRENQKLVTSKFDFKEVANHSVNQVFARSVNTSLTTLSTLAILFFWGGKTTQSFVGALFVGLLVGTYSSLFVASPLLVLLNRKK